MVANAAVAVQDLEPYRRDLTGFCYRMLGSGFEAEDAVQETMIRAWRHADDFEGRSSLRSWLYRIATNVCIDMSRQVQRRARPMEMGPCSAPDESKLGTMLPEERWVTPIADARIEPAAGNPEEVALRRESVRLAFVAALQHLPARQRATLILREVLGWQASEVAELLGTSVAGVNSALQRARATLGALPPDPVPAKHPLDEADADLLRRYLEAFERYDIDRFVALLHADATQSMPPWPMWIQGAADIGTWMVLPGPSACRGSRMLATSANGCPAFGQYKIDPAGGWAPWAIQVLEISAGKVAAVNYFLAMLDGRLFAAFGLPNHLDPENG